MRIINFLIVIVFVRVIILETLAMSKIGFLKIYTQENLTAFILQQICFFCCCNIPSWVLKGDGEKSRRYRVRLKYADIKIRFLLHLKSLKVIGTSFTRIGCLGCLSYGEREPSIYWHPALWWAPHFYFSWLPPHLLWKLINSITAK